MNNLSILDCKSTEDEWFIFSTNEGFFLNKIIINEGSKALIQKGKAPITKVLVIPQNARLCKGINLIKNFKRTNIFAFSGNGGAQDLKKNCVFIFSDTYSKEGGPMQVPPKIISRHEYTLNPSDSSIKQAYTSNPSDSSIKQAYTSNPSDSSIKQAYTSNPSDSSIKQAYTSNPSDSSIKQAYIKENIDNNVYNIVLAEGLFAVVFQNKCTINCGKFETEYKKALEKSDTFEVETCDNKNGLCIVKRKDGNYFIMTLGTNKGEIYVAERSSNIDLGYRVIYEKTIKAHIGNIEEMAINKDYTMIATASDNGTLIRVFDITTEPVQKFEFRRGSSGATIYSLVFNSNSTFLACSSSNGTVHIFDLIEDQSKTKNVKSYFNSISSIMPLFGDWMSSTWSFQNYQNLSNSKIVCKFDENYNLLHVLTYDGNYYYIHGDNFENISERIDIKLRYDLYENYMTFNCKSSESDK